MSVSPLRITHHAASIEVSIDGRRYRATTQVAFHGNLAIGLDNCGLTPLPPRLAFLTPVMDVQDVEIEDMGAAS